MSYVDQGESGKKQLDQALNQGKAFMDAIREMTGDQAADGGLKAVDDFLIGYAVEKAEGTYEWKSEDELVWRSPREENAHVEVVVVDKKDKRFLPDLDVTVSLFDESGAKVGTQNQEYLWHPWLFHYGRNWVVPKSGQYKMRVEVKSPAVQRRARKVVAEFDAVNIQTGHKKS